MERIDSANYRPVFPDGWEAGHNADIWGTGPSGMYSAPPLAWQEFTEEKGNDRAMPEQAIPLPVTTGRS